MPDSPRSEENVSKHKGIPKEVRYIIFGAIVDKLVSPVLLGPLVGAAFGVVTTLLFLLKVGLLHLAQLPAATIITLIVLEIVIIVLIFVLTIIYVLHAILQGTIAMLSHFTKTKPPKRPRWLYPIDLLALWAMTGVGFMYEWYSKRVPGAASPDPAVSEAVERVWQEMQNKPQNDTDT